MHAYFVVIGRYLDCQIILDALLLMVAAGQSSSYKFAHYTAARIGVYIQYGRTILDFLMCDIAVRSFLFPSSKFEISLVTVSFDVNVDIQVQIFVNIVQLMSFNFKTKNR